MVANPRFPHQCRIYRLQGATSFNPEGGLLEVYSGPCRKSSSSNIRTFNTGSNSTGKVDIADYRVSMPGIVKGIQKGDLIDVTDLTGTETGMRIVNIDSTNLSQGEAPRLSGEAGLSQVKGNAGLSQVNGATAVLCNLPSN